MSVNSKMTAIADEIRELSGTAEIMGLDAMANYIGEANDEVDNQVELLTQAVAALEGKAGASDGGSVETCSLIINDSSMKLVRLIYQHTLGESIEIEGDPMTSTSDIYEVVCGSMFYVDFSGNASIVYEGCEQVYHSNFDTTGLYVITAGAGESVTFDVSL